MLPLFIAAATLAGCGATAELSVDLRTDLVPGGVEFSAAETILSRDGIEGARALELVPLDASVQSGLRIADFTGLQRGRWRLRVILRSAAGAPVVERPVEVDLDRDRGVTVVITRDCRGVACPRADDDPALEACLGGRCVRPDCTSENPAACPDGACTTPADCIASDPCVESDCALGVCLFQPRHDACAPSEHCRPDVGCLPRPAGCSDAEFGPAEMLLLRESGPNEGGPHYMGASLSLYFDTRQAITDDFDVWFAERDDDGTVVTSAPVGAVSTTPTDEASPSASYDDCLLVFGTEDIFVAERPSGGEPFGSPRPVPALATGASERHPALSADGLAVYLAVGVGADFDIYVSTRPSRLAEFGTPSPVGEVNTPDWELAPFISADGLELWFGRVVDGGHQILRAARSGTDAPWGAPREVAELNSAVFETSPALSADGRRVAFVSDRAWPGMVTDVWEATRACAP